MAMKVQIVAVSATYAALTTILGAIAEFPVRADDLQAAIFSGVSQLRQACGVISDEPRLTAAAQRHADDLVRNGVQGGHTGSDGSSPQARIVDAGYARPGHTSEIIYWGSGSHANPSGAIDLWMNSPPHRAIILDCAFTAAGFAISWAGNMMIVVGDFAGP